MPRVNHGEVRAILTAEISGAVSDEALAAYIAQAGAVMEARMADVGGGDLLPASTMKEVERNLAAHFAALSTLPEGVGFERQDDAQTNYRSAENPLANTSFGQRAMMLDTTGALKAFDQTEIAFHVL